MEAAATFCALIAVVYVYLSIVGYRCASAAADIVEKALGKKTGSSPHLPQILALPFILWISGLSALIQTERKYIARTAELYIDEPKMPATDKKKIREAVRSYRQKYSLY